MVVLHVEASSSATNASLTVLPTKSGNSSERKRKSSARQFGPAGTLIGTRRTVTSRSLPPRTAPPPSGVLACSPWGRIASAAAPLVSIAADAPSVGNPANPETVAAGAPDGIVSKVAVMPVGSVGERLGEGRGPRGVRWHGGDLCFGAGATECEQKGGQRDDARAAAGKG